MPRFSVPDQKFAQAFADDIVHIIRHAHVRAMAMVVFDDEAHTWSVRVVVGARRHELVMPSPGGRFEYWLNGAFVRELDLRLGDVDATPTEVADRFAGAALANSPADLRPTQ